MINPYDPHTIQRLAKKAGYRTLKLSKWYETQTDPAEGRKPWMPINAMSPLSFAALKNYR